MTLVLAVVYLLTAVMMGAATGFAFMFYRDFFASDSFPLEWDLLLGGMAGIAVSFLLRAAGAVIDVGILGPGAAIFLLLGSALIAVAGFILWDKFRL